jgi:hypothetical protein
LLISRPPGVIANRFLWNQSRYMTSTLQRRIHSCWEHYSTCDSATILASIDAQRLLAQRRAEIVSGTHLGNKSRQLLVNDILDALLRDYKINEKDYGWCERVTRKHLRPFFGDRRAARLPHDIGEKYIEHRQAQGAMNATINREIALLRRSFNLAKRSGKRNRYPYPPK